MKVLAPRKELTLKGNPDAKNGVGKWRVFPLKNVIQVIIIMFYAQESILQNKLRQVLSPVQVYFLTQAVARNFYPPDGDTQQIGDFLGIQVEP